MVHKRLLKSAAMVCVSSLLSLSTLAKAKDAKDIVIGVSLPTQRDVGWVRYKNEIEASAKRHHVKVIIQSADQDAQRQSNQVDNLLSQKIDVLLLAPQDAKAAATLVDKAHKSKVRVISFDRLIMNAPVDYYISFDNEKVGELQGQYIADHVKSGNIIVLSGAPTDNNAALFKCGAMKILEKKKNLKIVTDQPILDWQPSKAQGIVEESLTKNRNNIKAVLAPNDNTAGGVIQALAAQKLSKKVIVTGMDAEVTAAKRIMDGTQSMTVFKDQKKLADSAINLATEVATKGSVKLKHTVCNDKVDVPAIFLDPVVVDKNNLNKVLVQSGYIEKSDLK